MPARTIETQTEKPRSKGNTTGKKRSDGDKRVNTERFVKCMTLRTKQPTHLESSSIDYLKI
jgi:hypothetical protein